MRFFKICSESNPNNILNKFDELSEFESHNILTSWFESYYSTRIGIHSYIRGNRVHGYYETGKTYARGERLISQKNWFFLTVNPRKNKTEVKGIIVGDILLTASVWAALLFVLIDCLKNFLRGDSLLELLLVLALTIVVLYNQNETQDKLYEEILSLVKNN